MLRKITTALVLINIFVSLHAAEVPVNLAKLVAENFLIKQVNNDPTLKGKDYKLSLSEVVKMKNSSKAALYIFDISKSGFVIIAGDDNVYPVLGFSFTNAIKANDLSPALSQWMDDYVNQISFAANDNVKNSETSDAWEAYKSNIVLNKSGKINQVQPLLLTTWNQDNFYNADCPADAAGPDGHVYVGCVATAMGQIMKYYNYPQQGIGSHGYSDWTYGYQFADFGNTTYNWTAMPNDLHTDNNAVAELLYHCGVSVEMGYSTTGSGAQSDQVVPALIYYFGYNSNLDIENKDDYSEQQWISKLKTNLNALMPLYYSAYGSVGGHAFVFDGYYEDALGVHFHINWGWSGYGNGYFYVNNLNSVGGNFDSGHQAIFNIIPDQDYPMYCTGSHTITETAGTFNDGSGIYEYKSNSNCSWLIDPTVNVINITLTFDRFDTEINNDLVTVYDGDNTSAPVLGTFSGATLPAAVTSTGKKMLITFNTNGSIVGQGWSASFSALKPVYCSNVTILTDETGSVSDGSGIYNYNANTDCRWRIQPPNANSITLDFTAFDVQLNEDKLEIYDVSSTPYTLLDSYSGSQIPTAKTYNVSKLLLWFKSQNNPKSGWSVNYSSTVSAIEDLTFTNNIIIYPNPADETIHIDIDKSHPECIVKVFDICDKLIYASNIYQTANIIDIKNFKKGIYTLQLVFKNEIEIKKFVKF